jgi:hypothetical protein
MCAYLQAPMWMCVAESFFAQQSFAQVCFLPSLPIAQTGIHPIRHISGAWALPVEVPVNVKAAAIAASARHDVQTRKIFIWTPLRQDDLWRPTRMLAPAVEINKK